ncbi:MAG: nicotinate-nucleotide--dimethylbenzimidazole phosphoribosyltransferase, partial [Clostridia bacterium]
GMQPILQLGMRLGEGSGCPMMFMLADAAVTILTEMATFEEASIDAGYLAAISSGNSF